MTDSKKILFYFLRPTIYKVDSDSVAIIFVEKMLLGFS